MGTEKEVSITNINPSFAVAWLNDIFSRQETITSKYIQELSETQYSISQFFMREAAEHKERARKLKERHEKEIVYRQELEKQGLKNERNIAKLSEINRRMAMFGGEYFSSDWWHYHAPNCELHDLYIRFCNALQTRLCKTKTLLSYLQDRLEKRFIVTDTNLSLPPDIPIFSRPQQQPNAPAFSV